MDPRFRATLLGGVALLMLLAIFGSLPGAPAQGGASITPLDQSPNNPWKMGGVNTGVTLRRAAFVPADPAAWPFLSGLADLDLNFTYRLDGGTNSPEIISGGFYFTVDGTAPSDATAVQCNNVSPPGTPFPCMLNDGGWCRPTPSERCPTGSNATTDTTTTQLVPFYTEKGTSNSRSIVKARFLRTLDGAVLPDGQPITFLVRVRWQERSAVGLPVHDLSDSNGGAFYHFRVDTQLPNGTLSSLAGAYNKRSDRIEVATNTRTPLLVFNFTDATTGSGIHASRVRVLHGGADNTTQYDSASAASHHVVMTYSYAAGKGRPFKANAVTALDAVVVDRAGNVHNVRSGGTTPTFAGWNLTVDTLAPQVTAERIVTPNNATTVAPGSPFTVRANVTDPGFDAKPRTAAGLQRVHAVLHNASRNLWSPEFVLQPTTPGSKTMSNATVAVPATWPDSQVQVRINATDKVGNVATKVAGTLALDTRLPSISVTPVAAYARNGPYLVRATVTDNGTGVDPASVTLLYKVGAASAETSRGMVRLAGNQYSAEIPDQPDASVVSYRVRARDQAGGEASSLPRGFVVDKTGPVVGFEKAVDFVGQGPYAYTATIQDAGAGVASDPGPKLFWRVGTTGAFTTVNMTKDDASRYTGTVPDHAEGTVLNLYVEARDALGNLGTRGSAASPQRSVVDKTPPTFNLTAPARATDARFPISWGGTDAVAGIASFTVEFRESTREEWIALPELTATAARSHDFCAVGGKTYHFRGWARDLAGNEGAKPANPLATTLVDTAQSCVTPPSVALMSPNGGETLSGLVNVAWTAASGQFGGTLDITLETSPDQQRWTALQRGLGNSGTYSWDTRTTVTDGTYWLRVRATDPNGLIGDDVSDASFTVQNGIANLRDLDNDGLPDDWEREHFGTLQFGPKDDPDGDGYFNDSELRAGTNPAQATSNPGGPAARWSNAYWLVIALFAAVLAVTVLGLATRW